MAVRRVVTGRTATGTSVIVSDDSVEAISVALAPNSQWHNIWGVDEIQTLPHDGAAPAVSEYFPPVDGFRFGFFSVAPQATSQLPADLDLLAALDEFESKLPGLARHMEPADPGMHASHTVDCGVVLSGEVVLELDDGQSVSLGAGDTFVQNATRHRWSNVTNVPAVIAVAMIGARHRDS